MKFNLIITVISLSFLFLNINIGQAAPPDSTGLRTENGRNFIIHKVEPKEGWMSIARRYNVSMEQVKLANPGIQDLKIGQLVNVPVTSIIKINDPVETKIHKPEEKAIEAEVIAEAPPVKEKYRTAVVHKVATGETLYSICKKYNARTEEIREWNDIEDNNLQVGQELTVGYVFQYNNGKNLPPVTAVSKVNDDELYASAGEVKKTRKELRKEKRESKNNASEEIVTENSDLANTATIPAEAPEKMTKIEKATPVTASVKPSPEAGKKAVAMTEKGSASWIDDNDINPSKFYALHRSAPTGTIIKVTNRMNNKTVFVKVVGVLPNTGDNSNITIKLSKAAASKLDVIDARFQAELNYTIYE